MNRKLVLMSSVSTVALAAVATAYAADAPLGVVEAATVPEGFTLSVEGGALFGTNTIAEDKLGGSGPSGGVINIQDNLGYRAAISVGKRIDPMWDLRVTGAINQQMTSHSDATYSGGFLGDFYGTIDTDFDYETLDFEVGYRPALTENMDVRLFGGIRGMHYKDSIDKMGTYYISGGPDKIGYGADYSTEFLGAGPRVGIEASTRLGDSMFGVSGMVAGAALFGTARTDGDITFTYFSGGSGGTATIPVPGTEETRTVFNLEAALGLDMHIDDAATLTLGYRAEGLFGLKNELPVYSGGAIGSGSEDRWTHGPTIKLTGYFD